MFDIEAENKAGSPRVKIAAAVNSFSVNNNPRRRIENYKDNCRRELLTKYGSQPGASASKFSKTSKRKENLRGGGCSGGDGSDGIDTVHSAAASSCARSKTSENYVPSNDIRRYISRRDQNKTDAQIVNDSSVASNLESQQEKEPMLVRETKTSRLRAALMDAGMCPSPSSKKAAEKSKIAISSSSTTCNSLGRKEVDKSHKRKSYLNRSHTSEGVYDDIQLPGESVINRRRFTKNSLLDVVKAKTEEMPTFTGRAEISKFPSNEPVTKDSPIRAEKSLQNQVPPKRSINVSKKLQSGSDQSASLTADNSENLTFSRKHNPVEDKKPEPLSVAESRINASHLRKLENRFLARKPSEMGPKSFASADNSPPKRNTTEKSRQSPDDFVRRAELLAASTLKMINRLDEIAKGTRRHQATNDQKYRMGGSERASDQTTFDNVFKTFDSAHKTSETKKVPACDESTAKQNSSSSLNRRNSRQATGTASANSLSDRDVGKMLNDNEWTKFDSPMKSPKSEFVSKPSSILKKKVTCDALTPSAEIRKSKPVSILKRKCLSQDESQSKTNLFGGPPVTFSPSVLEKVYPSKRQGILKKRRSLDENEVLRRQNFMPDSGSSEFKPILKNQRSSLEDLTGRSRSPDYLPQSILKRKSSKDEETEESSCNSAPEPQSILKRKSLSGFGHHHVKIADSVILAAAATMGEMQINENVRPILKKKSSSEEHSTPELSITEAPKPILKKKSSLETDEMEDKPKKPILKTARKASLEEPDDGRRTRSSSIAEGEAEHVKPILKRENSKSRIADVELEKNWDEVVILRRVKPNRIGRPLSSSDIDDELSAIFNKRRSLEFQLSNATTLDWERRRAMSVSLGERVKDSSPRRPSSVAEKINSLENFLRMESERRNARTESLGFHHSTAQLPPGKSSPTNSTMESLSAGSGPKFRQGVNAGRSMEIMPSRYCNDEPNISEGISASQSTPESNHQNFDEEIKLRYLEESPATSVSFESDSENDIVPCRRNGRVQETVSPIRSPPLGSIREGRETKRNASIFRSGASCHSTDSDVSSNGLSNNEPDDSEYLSAVESCSRKISSLAMKEMEQKSNCGGIMRNAKEVADDIVLLQKSGSVSAKNSFFREMEKKLKATTKEEKIKPNVKGGGCCINKYRQKKSCDNPQKYHTQPISSQDVENALKSTRNYSGERSDDVENFEDELSSLSLSDRVRLFNERILKESITSSSSPAPAPIRKRGSRFRTQPVTTEEVETAQGQKRVSPLAASLMTPPDPDSLGLGILSVQSVKEKIYNHANAILQEKPMPMIEKDGKSKKKGILKNLDHSKHGLEIVHRMKKQSSESESSDNEVKSILKREVQQRPRKESEEDEELNAAPRGILKHPFVKRKSFSSSGENGSSDENETQKGRMGKNLASILQNVEPVKVQEPRGERISDRKDPTPGGREIRRFIKNDAVARRCQIAANRLKSNPSLVKSQSHSAVSSMCRPTGKSKGDAGKSDEIKGRALNGDGESLECKGEGRSGGSEDGAAFEGLRRSTTQPLDVFERQGDDDMSGASIRERLARLKKSGENDWQKRKSQVSKTGELSVVASGNYLFGQETCLVGRQRATSPQTPKESDHRVSTSILADRLDKLDAAKEGWRKRIPPSDAVQFSVEGRMLGKADSSGRSHLLQGNRAPLLAERKKRCPKAVIFRSKKNQPSLSSMPSSPLEAVGNPIARSVSAPGVGGEGLFTLTHVEANGPVVSVPRADDETFTSFFNGLRADVVLEERLEIKDEDLDVVSKMQSSQLLVQRRNVKLQRRRATLKNPLKTLAARNDLQEYTEIKTGIAEKELKRLKTEKASKNSTLAIEALAGLASQEDFTAINLKKTTDGGVNSLSPPFRDLMLLQIKGRRHVQTRMVEPVAESVNAGDCFVLVTQKKIFHYIGEYANVIEKSRGAEISLHIQQNSDLGCTASSVITIGGGGRATTEQIRDFWKLLGGESSQQRPAGHPDEDEIFESAVIDTNMIYEVVNDEIVPVETYWGTIPRIEVLNSNKILVFDFGSEFYVWIGKNVSIPNRKVALKLARELWEEGYDYTECDLCPLSVNSYLTNIDEVDGIPDSMKAGPVRPSWALFAKITENMETVLFREKFLDWPDFSRVIRRSNKDSEGENLDASGAIEIKPCDAKDMLECDRLEPDLVLEGNHLGRGVRYFEEETRRCAEITTRDVKVWHISEYEYSQLPADSLGQFHTGDSYVVRWHYLITITGRELNGQPSKHMTVGRDRFAYFYWQGRDSPINDKGAAACLTVELDREHGPQVRVTQGFEPPAFLNLFRGGMVVHSGRRDSEHAHGKWRQFICRGEDELETVLFEVPNSMRHLRSAASFILINNETGIIIVWHGLKSPGHVQRMALKSAKYIRRKMPLEFSFKSKNVTIREEVEGSETGDFFRAVGGDKRQLYYSFLNNEYDEPKTPRMFHLSSVSGEFHFSEVSAPSYNAEVVSPYLFLQEDLYSAPQPALILIDTGYCLWLWQGWWEAESGEGDRGSGIHRFQAERRAAMITAFSYWTLKYGNTTPKAYLVWAGLEPLVFTNLFPIWTDRDNISEINMREGRKPGEIVLVQTELANLTQTTYPLAQLQSRPLPVGVNPSFLEDYLEPQCFQTLFGMTTEEFYNLPSWKKKKLKQDAGLF